MNPIYKRLQALLDQELQDATTANRFADYRQVLLVELGRLPRTDSFWIALLHLVLLLDPGLPPQQRADDFLNAVRALPVSTDMPVYFPKGFEQMRSERQDHDLLTRLIELGGSELAERIRTEFGGRNLFIPRFAPRCSAAPDAGSGTATESGQPVEPSP